MCPVKSKNDPSIVENAINVDKKKPHYCNQIFKTLQDGFIA